MEKEPFGKYETKKIQCLENINETLKEMLNELQIMNNISKNQQMKPL